MVSNKLARRRHNKGTPPVCHSAAAQNPSAAEAAARCEIPCSCTIAPTYGYAMIFVDWWWDLTTERDDLPEGQAIAHTVTIAPALAYWWVGEPANKTPSQLWINTQDFVIYHVTVELTWSDGLICTVEADVEVTPAK